MKFAQELKEPVFEPRTVIAGKDARTLAEDVLAMTQEEFSAAFRKSPMKRAKLAGLQRNARVMLANSRAPWLYPAPPDSSFGRFHGSGGRKLISPGAHLPRAAR